MSTVKFKLNFKSNIKEKITAIMFLIVIFVLLTLSIVSVKSIETQFLTSYRSGAAEASGLLEKVNIAIDSVESAVRTGNNYSPIFVEVYGFTQKIMGKRVFPDLNYGALYKTSHAQITYAVGEKDLSSDLDGLLTLKSELDALGIPLLYIQAPFKLPEGEQQLPINVRDYSNENADRFLEHLNDAGIDYLDLRPGFWSSGMTQNQLFFNTDHHWNIDGAFLSMKDIENKLNEDYNFKIDAKYSNLDNFTRKTYKDFYIGSMGRRVGKLYGGVDDFTLITPNFETSYTLYERDYGGEKVYKGSFEGAVLTNSYLDEKAPLTENRYAVYHGDNAELEFVNNMVDSGKVLMVKDSFGLPIYCFLSLAIHETRALDLRLFKGSVSGYAKEHKPDVVIVMYNSDCFGGTMFDFDSK